MSFPYRGTLVMMSTQLLMPMLFLFGSPLSLAVAQTNSEQQPVTIKNDEFSIRMPIEPSVRVERGVPYSFGDGQVKYQVEAGVYKSGVVFLVEVYDNTNPDRFLMNYRQWPTPSRRWANAVTSEITLNGLKVQQYVVKTDALYLISRVYNSKRRSYVITVATRDETNPAVKGFFATLTLNGKALRDDLNDSSATVGDPVTPSSSSGSVSQNTSHVFSAKDLDRRAQAIWKAEPSYTEEARQRRINGTVTLRAILSSTGEVADIFVVKGLGRGLTEKAIEAAKKMKFLPAEKNGALVSQWILLEYNFHLY